MKQVKKSAFSFPFEKIDEQVTKKINKNKQNKKVPFSGIGRHVCCGGGRVKYGYKGYTEARHIS